MSSVIHLTRSLDRLPQTQEIRGIALRSFRGAEDIAPWLSLRRRAFSRERLGVGDWSEADFQREFLEKCWWQPDRFWLAFAQNPSNEQPNPVITSDTQVGHLVGAVAMATREVGTAPRAALHWLMVDPSFRRRGLGRLLVTTLESAAWHDGFREVWLETHSAWQSATRLYATLGYRLVPPAESTTRS